MNNPLEREEIEFIFDLYRPQEQAPSLPSEPATSTYKNLRQPEQVKNEGVPEYLS